MSEINSDKTLIKRLSEDNDLALTEIYNAYWKLLYASAFNILKNKQQSEDVVQNVFISLWSNRKQLEIKVSLKSYLYACTRYQVFAVIRKNEQKLHVDLLDNIDSRLRKTSPETKLIYKELVEQIDHTISLLPKKCRIVYKLSREKHLSHKEISQKLNISTKTVENHITKALSLLGNSLGYLRSVFLLFFI